jgi:energy-converting hydrogenase Eha subunit A
MSDRLAALITGLVFATVGAAHAQTPRPLPATAAIRFESWQPSAAFIVPITPAAGQVVAASRDRERHALIGGAIGAVVGVAACTAISTLVDDAADGGLSACPLDTYLLFGVAGFGLGFAVGWGI